MDSLISFGRRRQRIKEETPKRGLGFRRFHPAADGEMYNAWRRDAWLCAHNTEEGYEDVYLTYAAVRSKNDPDSVWVATYDGAPCGLLELDTRRGALHGSGWISFFYLSELYRGRGLGRKMMEKAAEVYRSKGRKKLALCAAEDNSKALGFYDHLGFVRTGEQMGALSRLFDLERRID